ncbi:MAG: hypothetical protein ACK4J0_03610 [Candidatus Anstonellaceae archaeon]
MYDYYLWVKQTKRKKPVFENKIFIQINKTLESQSKLHQYF